MTDPALCVPDVSPISAGNFRPRLHNEERKVEDLWTAVGPGFFHCGPGPKQAFSMSILLGPEDSLAES